MSTSVCIDHLEAILALLVKRLLAYRRGLAERTVWTAFSLLSAPVFGSWDGLR